MTPETLHDALGLLPADLITAADKVRSRPRKKSLRPVRWIPAAACIALILYSGLLFTSRFSGSTDTAAECAPAEGENYAPTLAAEAQAPQEAADSKSQVTGQSGAGIPEYSDLDTIALTPTGVPSDQETTAAASESAAECVLSLADTQYVPTPLHQDSAVNTSANAQTVLIQSREALEQYYEDNSRFFDMEDFYESCRRYSETWFAEHDLLLLRLGAASAARYQVTSFEALEHCESPTWELTLTQAPASGESAYWHILMEAEKSAIQPGDVILIQIEEEPS